jgi:hypothetical protein
MHKKSIATAAPCDTTTTTTTTTIVSAVIENVGMVH